MKEQVLQGNILAGKRLFPQKLAGRKTGDSLKETGEMVREIETQQAGSLADVLTLHQQTFRLIYNIVVDVADGCATCGLVDNITEITGRIGQFGGTIGNGGQTVR